MKSKIFIVLSLTVASVAFCSCSHYYYAPNMQNVPLFQKKGETRINIARSAGVEFSAFELQGAHSFTNHLSGMFNLATGGSNQDDSQRGNGTFAEAAAGYFAPFGKHGIAEGYGGFGIGAIRNEYGSIYDFTRVHFLKSFVQPDIGLRFSFFELAVSARLAMLNYVGMKGSPASDVDASSFIEVENHKTTFLVEPAITLRLGWKYVLLQIQVGESANSFKDFPQETQNVNAGIIFTIPPSRKNSAVIN